MRIFKYIVSLFLCLAALDTSAQYYEKRKRDWRPSEFYLSLDAVSIAKTMATDDRAFEVQGKLDFDVYYLVLDWGIQSLNLNGDDFEYSSQGSFFRIGPQFNLMPYNELRSNIYMGLMYGQSNFSDEVTYRRSIEFWEDEDLLFNNSSLVSRWAEFNMGINGRIYKNFYLGFLVRFKFAKTLSGDGVLSPYLVPGYGREDTLNRFGFSYYITYRIPFRDKPIPTKPRYISNPEQNSGQERGPNRQGDRSE